MSGETQKVSSSSGTKYKTDLDDDRDEKDSRIISLGLHVVRNLLAIKDAMAEGTATGEKEEFAHLQVSC